jgi:hypothetical protein
MITGYTHITTTKKMTKKQKITKNKIIKEINRLRNIAINNCLDINDFIVREFLNHKDFANYDFLKWCINESPSCYYLIEIKEKLGYGNYDDYNYQGKNLMRFGEPLTARERTKLNREIKKFKRKKLKELLF